MSHAFLQLNVFSKDPFKGNPLAVVKLEGGRMTDKRLKELANWTNLSETVFLERSHKADFKARIFTPKGEIPFAGHPSLGALCAALHFGHTPKNKAQYKLECGVGIVNLKKEGRQFWVEMPKAEVSTPDLVRQRLLRLLTQFEGADSRLVNLGPKWLVAEVTSRAALLGRTPAPAEIKALCLECGAGGLTLFAQYEDQPGQIEVRSYAPLHGIEEDPVCGSGNGAVAAYLKDTDGLKSLGSRYLATQGEALGRQGEVQVEVVGEQIWIGGEVQIVIEGKLEGLTI
ncbi:MAG: hypothetical protein A2527_05055 [Candidatus Lambdaproteobacteria bacterium RIFOXYD2_FULL_50_16]|uniref:Phenazine biosynthesis protein PhzF n=1 Tax=Candidatus Lambdaproteobacteria bacterium RIFOXYD2_FULL_50_16 TaxID=1817772 RepID=A0A1F6G9U7_9PROT|nr:MAG: hypothetical protein A2527_05055 [Candidatus Lambdaproteobacteria bacterium RIFOXYD2_FULL_50_16]